MEKLDMESLQVLLIDDESFMRQLLIQELNGLQIEAIEQASNGEEGLKKVKEADSAFDIILCDLEMPGMDGQDFVRFLRHLPDAALANIPVLIITGHDDIASKRNADIGGIQGFLVKPVNSKALEKGILSAIK